MYRTRDLLTKLTTTAEEERGYAMIRDTITQRLVDNVNAIVQNHPNRDAPLLTNELTSRLLIDLEAVFLNGSKSVFISSAMRDKYAIPPLSFWDLLMVYTHKSMISQINNLNQITSDIGRSRAWIRLALNQGTMTSYFSAISNDHRHIKKSYAHYAFLRSGECIDILRKLLDGLESFTFDLAVNSRLLNDWTEAPMLLSGAWDPPARTDDALLQPVEPAMEVMEDSFPSKVDKSGPPKASIEDVEEPVAYAASSRPAPSRNVGVKEQESSVSSTSSQSTVDVGTSTNEEIPNTTQPTVEQTAPIIPEPILNLSSQPSASQMQTMEATRKEQALKRELLEDAVFSACFSNDKKGLAKANKDSDMSEDDFSTVPLLEGDSTSAYAPAEICRAEPKGNNNESKESSSVQSPVTSSLTDQGEGSSANMEVPKNVIGRNRGWSFSCEDDEQLLPTSSDHPRPSSPVEVARKDRPEAASYADILQEYGPTGLANMGTPDFNDFLIQYEQPPQVEETTSPMATEEADTGDFILIGDPKTFVPDQYDLTNHLNEVTKELGLESQKFQCAECNRPIGLIYGKERLCMYSGQYFCYECHQDDSCEIPARIIYNWDFKKYPVCIRAKETLERMFKEPAFNLKELNPELLDMLPELSKVKNARTRLHYLRGYLFTCKESTANELRKLIYPSEYLYEHINLYSMHDFLLTRTGEMLTKLVAIEKVALSHHSECELCKAKGFICELCSQEPPIYPFQTDSTFRCGSCGAVYHYKCWQKNPKCQKCKRIGRRQEDISKWVEMT